jgi:hypothetical protein
VWLCLQEVDGEGQRVCGESGRLWHVFNLEVNHCYLLKMHLWYSRPMIRVGGRGMAACSVVVGAYCEVVPAANQGTSSGEAGAPGIINLRVSGAFVGELLQHCR